MRTIATFVFVAVLAGASVAAAQTIIVGAAHTHITCGTEPTELGGRLKDRNRRVMVQVPETSTSVTVWIEGKGNGATNAPIVGPDKVWSSGGLVSSKLKVFCQAATPSDVKLTETL